jgi:hypothetical protein
MLLKLIVKILFLLFKKGCITKDTPVLMANNNPFKAPALAYSLAALPLIAPIQDIKPDDLVKAYHHEQSYYATAYNNDPKVLRGVPGWQDYDYINITPETWQIGTFEIIEANGDKVEVEANRPKTWYSENNVSAIGDKAYFYMPEIGINGEATLLSVRPTVINTTNFAFNESSLSRSVSNGSMVDRPVITTFKRNAPVVYDYHFSDGAVIGATPEHPFFSVDRNNYIAVGELQVGEQVMTAGEKVVKFIAGKQREKGEPVYNFEVWREHNYYVGSKEGGEFLLVHNTCHDEATKICNNLKLKKKLGSPGQKKLIKKNVESDAIKDHPKYKNKIREKDGQIEICYDDLGFPDFNAFVPELPGIGRLEFPINMAGNYSSDYTQALSQMSFMNPLPKELKEIKVPGYPDVTWTLHHHQDGKTMQLIPDVINRGGADHVGGRAISEAGGQNIFPGPNEIDNFKSGCN